MKDKLRDLMKRENITATKLAAILDIQPAGISHILAGRNKPGYELICKIVTRFPHVNPYWLLGDAENMYNDNFKDSGLPTAERATAESDTSSAPALFPTSTDKFTAGGRESAVIVDSKSSDAAVHSAKRSDVAKIVIFYDDSSFEVFNQRP